jgi:hypothetical protein
MEGQKNAITQPIKIISRLIQEPSIITMNVSLRKEEIAKRQNTTQKMEDLKQFIITKDDEYQPQVHQFLQIKSSMAKI